VILSGGDAVDDETIAADTVIFCTGIRSNIEIARDAGLTVGRGILVNDRMQTVDPDIYAVGECAEHDGHVYGLVSPGLEQASVAAANIAGRPKDYAGSMMTTKLKIVGVDVFSMGEVAQAEQNRDVRLVSYRSPDGRYRRLILNRGRLVGGIGVGGWPEINRIQQKILVRDRIPLWRRWRFSRSGRLWSDAGVTPVSAWPAAATVCNCTGVTRGTLSAAIGNGCATLEGLQRETCASTVCGTCRPLLQELLGGTAEYKPVGWMRALAVVSILSLLAGLLTLVAPVWPVSRSVQSGFTIDLLWIDSFWKQVTGFTLLGLGVLAAVLSLRKRIRKFSFGGYDGWRLVHGVLGVSILAVLLLHTGLRLGANLNMWLMATMLAAAGIGGLAGIVTAIEHRLRRRAGGATRTAPRTIPVWLHIIAVWPLPILLSIHVLTVYFY
jgi:nitrite reductase (NADH) large subunit